MTQSTNTDMINANPYVSTKDFFTNINLPPVNVSQNVDDAVIAYFQQITENKESAQALAAAVIVTSVSQGIDPMETIQEFLKMDKNKLSGYLAMFLNLSRVGTSYLGISNQPTIGKYVSRMILP